MLFYASLFGAFLITLLVISKVAELMLAKRFSFVWMLLASLVGSISAIISGVALLIFVKEIAPMTILIASLATMFIVSSAAFKYINRMSWPGAVTTNIANVAVIAITMTAAVVLNGKSLEEEFSSLNREVNNQLTTVESTALNFQGNVVEVKDDLGTDVSLDDEPLTDSFISENELIDKEEIEPQITEQDFLPPDVVKALKQAERKRYKEPKFRPLSVSNIHTVVGYTIRILKKNGTVLSGSLKKIRGSNVYVAQRLSSGVAIIPLSTSKIKKLEVYR